MKTLKILLTFIFVFSFIISCGSEEDDKTSDLDQDTGVIGSTCWSKPILKDPNGYNVCIIPKSTNPNLPDGEFFHALPLAEIALAATISFCKEANTLDYGYLAGPGKSCFKECEKITYCLHMTNL